ncbi:hypothetical protein GPJ56_008585 [Histomonas meleagridis]|uniref:uncharacterized protein n=1 Tax=Histomonas meleagridis TaxID=135588 RepID=UPI00355A077F|nr:hypothetical protein GPJ56_008585 [Histomonas meleagridis]KAH0805838.1 hypothetical protein GO595_001477 [Histomonas meleagridis]
MTESQPENKEESQTVQQDTPKKEAVPEQEKIQENTQEKKSNSLPIIIVISIVLLAIILFLIFGRKKRIVVFDKPIPYIFNKDFYETLSKYVNLPSQEEALVIYGSSGVGKTRGLLTFGEEMITTGRLLFDFDFQLMSKVATMDDLVSYIKSIIFKSIKGYADAHSKTSYELKNPLALIESLTSVDQNNSIKVPVLFRDPIYQKLITNFYFIASEIKNDPKHGLEMLLQSIDILAPCKPILIIHDFDNLYNSVYDEQREFVESFWSCLVLFISTRKDTPIIIEVSDQNAFFDGTIPLNNHHFRLYHVEEFDKKTSRKILVGGDIFNKKDFEFIASNFGFNGESFATIHDMLREGGNVNTAYENYCTIGANLITRFIENNSTSKERNAKIDYLKKLIVHPVMISTDIAISRSLIDWKIATLVNETHCSYQNRIIEQSAKNILSNI